MSRKAYLVLPALLLAACAAYQAQHSGGSGAEEKGPLAPADPHAHHAAPSAEFLEMSDGEQLARVRGEVEETKKNLERQGKYACCVRPACNECLLKYGECHCREAVRDQGPCCGECTEAWVEGRGAVEGIEAWELLERKKQQVREREGSGKQHKEDPPHHH
jgi:predicted Zn-ribbon and HTH transcriptional regulator